MNRHITLTSVLCLFLGALSVLGSSPLVFVDSAETMACEKQMDKAPPGLVTSVTLDSDRIFTNVSCSAYNDANVVVDAKDAWWDSVDGPQPPVGTDEMQFSQGYGVSAMKNTMAELSTTLGNKITEKVDSCLWLGGDAGFDAEIYAGCNHPCDDFCLDFKLSGSNIRFFHFEYPLPSCIHKVSSTGTHPNLVTFYTTMFDTVLHIDGSFDPNFTGTNVKIGEVCFNHDGSCPNSVQTFTCTYYEVRNGAGDTVHVSPGQAIINLDYTKPGMSHPSGSIFPCYNAPTDPDWTCWNFNFSKGAEEWQCKLLQANIRIYKASVCDPSDLVFTHDFFSASVPGDFTVCYPTNQADRNAIWNAIYPTYGDGTYYVRLTVKDSCCNETDTCDALTFCTDTYPPSPPTNLVARPGHNKVKLSWTNATSDFHHVVVMRTDWSGGSHGYPEYDDSNAEGPYPSDTSCSGCDRVYAGTGTSLTDVSDISNTTRDVYHYKAFTVDYAGNVSIPSNGDRSTSYWLGDVTGGDTPPYVLGNYDGYVYYQDLTFFSTTFRKSHGDGQYINEFDIGPTVSGSPKGIPTTDNIIDFEDLSIFSINYDAVNPSMKIAPIFAEEEITGPLGLQLLVPATNYPQVGEAFKVRVLLRNNPDVVKGIHFVVPYDPSQLQFIRVDKSKLLQGTPLPVFFDGRDIDKNVDVSLALLGGEATIGGSGEIATITFRLLQAGNPSLAFSLVDLRDNQNHKLLAGEDVAQLQSGSVIPQTYGLSQNYPNAFNPETQIAYQLPMGRQVSLKIYNIKGELVRTLVDEYKEAGYHTVRWDGRNNDGNEVASGVYFYRLVTNDFTSTKKMIMLK